MEIPVADHPYFLPSTSFANATSEKGLFEGSVLILPVVSLGNVPQLAVDLLLEAGKCHRIGRLDPTDHIAVVGAGDGCPVEVYQTSDRLVTILQQRSPVLKSRKGIHISRLTHWIARAGFKSILLLVSIDAATRTDAHLRHPSPLFHLTASHNVSELTRHLREQFAPFTDVPVPTVPILSAGGLARRLMMALRDANALLIYVAEGDSRPNAKILAATVLKALPQSCKGHWDPKLVQNDHWSGEEPASWKVADEMHSETCAELFG